MAMVNQLYQVTALADSCSASIAKRRRSVARMFSTMGVTVAASGASTSGTCACRQCMHAYLRPVHLACDFVECFCTSLWHQHVLFMYVHIKAACTEIAIARPAAQARDPCCRNIAAHVQRQLCSVTLHDKQLSLKVTGNGDMWMWPRTAHLVRDGKLDGARGRALSVEADLATICYVYPAAHAAARGALRGQRTMRCTSQKALM